MVMRIEDYALLGDGESAALVDRHGSIDWLCWPAFDSDTCFAALLGGPRNGHWQIAPQDPWLTSARRYCGETLILETTFESASGTLVLTDWMAWNASRPVLVRQLRCERGSVRVVSKLLARFDYGRAIPWCVKRDERMQMVCGPRALWLDGASGGSTIDRDTVCASFDMSAGERRDFVLTCCRSYEEAPPRPDLARLLADTSRFWSDWSAQCEIDGDYAEPIRRSLIVLRALTSTATGGIVAAPTSSLPELIGGTRNWDYRFCWLRDAGFTLLALLSGGYHAEAARWRDWLVRAIAGHPAQLQILYGVDGSRRADEWECPWLPGYEHSAPVRFGNAAVNQSQLDVYGEVLNALYMSRCAGLPPDADAWSLEQRLVDHMQDIWREPDDSIWEVRSGPRQFTFSKVMAWVAVNRALRSASEFGMPAPTARWSTLADEIREDVLKHAFDPQLQTFTQSYGSRRLDASCLLIPVVGFLPVDDPRVAGTVKAIERDLMDEGLLLRYREDEGDDEGDDGVPIRGQRPFLPCSFWLAQVRHMQGRDEEARELFDRLIALRNDVGLLAEKYDNLRKRQVGNFPQALSHVALANAGLCLRERTCADSAGSTSPTPGAAPSSP
ncbi:GH15 family glucan-1,4-alpha-glucosidase [Paraburkholderia fungorum]|uniref:GH15 family glucan-1,4-alpha-glucosidase n=2 Tax=Paraburkholderia fungorum TaxID=134537 RepID=A0AAW3UPC3_9BURK|nr:GH15 family glucan-1,4-alpha-glucosidase [Paraburkholderia fungorum]MBB6200213.1 GH15 family glucan-1,4-alpha-glucosidase [Paraburkholderia fungorum]